MNSKSKNLEKWCIENNRNNLLHEWDYESNKKTPNEYTWCSGQKVTWKCSKNHNWKATISHRVTDNTGCPKCNSQTSFPEQAIFYYVKQAFPNSINRYVFNKTELDIFIPDINVGIEYDGFHFHQKKENKDREKNKKCNVEGILLIRIREKGLNIFSDCKCIVRDNIESDITLTKCILELFDLLSKNIDIDVNRDKSLILLQYKKFKENLSVEKAYPELLLDWDKNLNQNLELKNFTKGSHYKATWKCHICGYKWKAEIKSRVRGIGCNNCVRIRTIEARSFKVLNSDNQTLYTSIAEAERQTGVERHSISDCCKGIRKTAGGYHWKFVNLDKDSRVGEIEDFKNLDYEVCIKNKNYKIRKQIQRKM